MNQKAALKRLNDLFILVRRMKPSVSKNELGITPREKRHIMEQLREISKLIKLSSKIKNNEYAIILSFLNLKEFLALFYLNSFYPFVTFCLFLV